MPVTKGQKKKKTPIDKANQPATHGLHAKLGKI
jgi:hypothetical protein